MSPRKSDHAQAAAPADADADTDGNSPADKAAQQSLDKRDKDKDKDKEKDKEREKDAVTIEDLNLPKSIITRLAKGVLPPNTQIQGNAILALSKSATVFISYLAAHANENTLAANKKTVSPADVFKALDDIEFSFLREPLEAEFEKFNAIQTEKRTSYRQKVRAAKHGSGPGDDTEMADTTTMASEASPSSAPRAKKQRVDPFASSSSSSPPPSIVAAGGVDDAETEEDEDEEEPDAEVHDDDDDDDDEDEEDDDAQDEDEEGEQGEATGDETQDALEERRSRDDGDEALDGDESD